MLFPKDVQKKEVSKENTVDFMVSGLWQGTIPLSVRGTKRFFFFFKG